MCLSRYASMQGCLRQQFWIRFLLGIDCFATPFCWMLPTRYIFTYIAERLHVRNTFKLSRYLVPLPSVVPTRTLPYITVPIFGNTNVPCNLETSRSLQTACHAVCRLRGHCFNELHARVCFGEVTSKKTERIVMISWCCIV